MSTQTTTTTTTSESGKSKIVAAAPSAKQSKSDDTKTFFLLDALCLSAPPVVLPAIPLLLSYYRSISAWDLFFSITFPLYMILVNRFRFDKNARQDADRKLRGEPYPEKPEIFSLGKEPGFEKYMMVAAGLGVILPLLLQFLAPEHIAEATAPHLYMLVCQILMETMVNGPKFHPALQAMNPVGFSAYRMSGIKTWLVVAWQMFSSSYQDDGSNALLTWEMAHFLLALSNVFMWTYNLFVTLLLRFVPQCLDQNQFPDANVSWDNFYQVIPTVHRSSDSSKVKSN